MSLIDNKEFHARLDRLENLLVQIEQNGRANADEAFYIDRKDLDGKQVTKEIRHFQGPGQICFYELSTTISKSTQKYNFSVIMTEYKNRIPLSFNPWAQNFRANMLHCGHVA